MQPSRESRARPQGRFFVIDRHEAAGAQLLRRDSDGRETRIDLPRDVRDTGMSVWPRGLDLRGRLVFVAESDDSWFWGPAVLDLNTNQVSRIPMSFAGDADVDAAWDGDNVTLLARRMECTIWRFDRTPD